MSLVIIRMEYPPSYGNPLDDAEFCERIITLYIESKARGVQLRVIVDGDEVIMKQVPIMDGDAPS